MKSSIKPILGGLLWKVTTKKGGWNINFSFHFSYEKAKKKADAYYKD